MSLILIIDDDPMIRSLFRAVLECDGDTVIEAEDGDHGLTIAAVHQPDLVITDIVMPNREGIATIRALRAQSSELPILAISGGGPSGSLSYLHFADALGASRTLAKPVRATVLRETVAEMLGRVVPSGGQTSVAATVDRAGVKAARPRASNAE